MGAVQARVSPAVESDGMHDHIRDAFLIAIVVTALILTASALHGLGRRLPPPPEVRPTAAGEVIGPHTARVPAEVAEAQAGSLTGRQ